MLFPKVIIRRTTVNAINNILYLVKQDQIVPPEYLTLLKNESIIYLSDFSLEGLNQLFIYVTAITLTKHLNSPQVEKIAYTLLDIATGTHPITQTPLDLVYNIKQWI